MAMCAGVQNVSRPMEMCQEISQISPRTILVAPRARSSSGKPVPSVCRSSGNSVGMVTAGCETASMCAIFRLRDQKVNRVTSGRSSNLGAEVAGIRSINQNRHTQADGCPLAEHQNPLDNSSRGITVVAASQDRRQTVSDKMNK